MIGWARPMASGPEVGPGTRVALCCFGLTRNEDDPFSWSEPESGEARSTVPRAAEPDGLPTVRMGRSSDSQETHRDLPKTSGIDPFGATLDDAGAARLDLEQTLPPIRAASARLVAPSLPSVAAAPSKPPSPAAPKPRPKPALDAPTEPELEPPPLRLAARKRSSTSTIVLVLAVLVILSLGAAISWYLAGRDAIVADPTHQGP